VKAYRFRLDSVLRVRQLQERVAAQQLAVAVRELQAARAQLARARRALAGLDAPSGRLTIGAVQWSHAQSDRMSETARRSADEAKTAGDAARQATQAWESASQRTAVLERLDERHLTLWRAELDRSDALVLDDLSTRRKTGQEGRPQ
jgi:flagellar export protein FliJ